MADKLFWNISKLRNWDKNPRAIKSDKFQELKNRIKKYGQFKPVIATIDGEVIGGNMRLRAMKDLDMQDIWVSVVEPKTEAEKIEIALADNEEMGYYQEDQLAELISSYKDEIKLESFSIHLGDGVNLEDLLNKYQPEEVIEDDAPEVEEEAISELGAIYQLGKHRLMCGDSTNIEQVEQLMDGNKADIVFTSPPYNANTRVGHGDIFSSKKSKKIYGNGYSDDLQSSEYVNFATNVLENCFLVTNGFIFWNVNYNANSRFEYIQQIINRLPNLIEQICWKKSSSIPFKGSLMRDWEPIYLFSTNGNLLGVDEVVSNFWQVNNRNSQIENHKACFPVELAEKAIKIIKQKTGIVFDPFGGSGTTLIACEQTDRQCYMMELDPRYVDVIRKRYAKFIGKENEWQEVTPRIN